MIFPLYAFLLKQEDLKVDEMLQKIVASFDKPAESLEKYIAFYWSAYNPTNEDVELPIVPLFSYGWIV